MDQWTQLPQEYKYVRDMWRDIWLSMTQVMDVDLFQKEEAGIIKGSFRLTTCEEILTNDEYILTYWLQKQDHEEFRLWSQRWELCDPPKGINCSEPLPTW